MKIISVDNFARENVRDDLVAENIRSKEFAAVMCKALNDKFCNHDYADRFYKVVEDDHKLWRGVEELV